MALFVTPADEAAAMDRILASDPRFTRDAYRLLFDGFTMARDTGTKDVPAPALLSGVIAAAVDQFGLCARVTVESMGLRTSADVAAAIENLASIRALTFSEDDTPERFAALIASRDLGPEIDATAARLFDVVPVRIVAGRR